MLDNIADLLLTVSLLVAVFEFPAIFALRYMIPGTAIGVLLGDLMTRHAKIPSFNQPQSLELCG